MNYWRLRIEGGPIFRRLLKSQLGHIGVLGVHLRPHHESIEVLGNYITERSGTRVGSA